MAAIDIIVQFDNEQVNLVAYEDDFDLLQFESWIRSRFSVTVIDRLIFRNSDDKGIEYHMLINL